MVLKTVGAVIAFIILIIAAPVSSDLLLIDGLAVLPEKSEMLPRKHSPLPGWGAMNR